MVATRYATCIVTSGNFSYIIAIENLSAVVIARYTAYILTSTNIPCVVAVGDYSMVATRYTTYIVVCCDTAAHTDVHYFAVSSYISKQSLIIRCAVNCQVLHLITISFENAGEWSIFAPNWRKGKTCHINVIGQHICAA